MVMMIIDDLSFDLFVLNVLFLLLIMYIKNLYVHCVLYCVHDASIIIRT